MKRTLCTLCIVAAVVAAAGAAWCQDGWKGTSGLLHVERAGTVGRGMLIFSLGSSYYRSDAWLYPGTRSVLNGTGLDSAEVDYHFFNSRAALTFGLSPYVEFSAALNIRNWIRQVPGDYEVDDGVHREFKTFTRGGIGDTDLLLKLCPPVPTKYVSVGVLGEVSFPTGREESAFSTNATDFGVTGLLSINFPESKQFVPTRLHFNVGYRFNKNEDDGYGIFYANDPDSSGFWPPAYPKSPEGESDNFNDVFRFGTGIEFIAMGSSLFAEFTWDKYSNASFAEGDAYYLPGSKNVYMITPGIKLLSENGGGATIAMDINLNGEDDKPFVGVPDWALYFMISVGGSVLPQDSDDDGIEDKVDKCPGDPEDFDGFEDTDGCPDLDNDKDSVKDAVDKCPDLAEDFDGYEDEDGCPDLDNDGDGIRDIDDRCPNEPEDFDGVQDTDGCPDIVKDSDNDGVADDVDKCPLKAEDADGFQDEDGCPDPDNDLDGILDANDTCPNEPETFNGYQDEDGCPDERPIEERFILRGVNFESGSAVITPDSYAILDQVVRSLKAYPDVRVEIAGFTDDVGKDDYNMGLSQRRADSVKQYLVNAGIAAERLEARGYGETNPIASNKNAAGRAENRRIEFKRLN